MRNRSFYPFLTLLLLAVLIGYQIVCSDAGAQECDTVTNIDGEYSCRGECVVTDPDGTKKVVEVTGEKDTIKRFEGAKDEIYQVDITGDNDFRETEIGVLVGRTLRTATARVSDTHFPVLEEDVFEVGPSCEAVGYTKVVRNPTSANFKACIIHCQKNSG